jgi:hypothetical protein
MMAKLTKVTHKIAIQVHLAAENCTTWEFSLQEASPETFGYTLVHYSYTCKDHLVQEMVAAIQFSNFCLSISFLRNLRFKYTKPLFYLFDIGVKLGLLY